MILTILVEELKYSKVNALIDDTDQAITSNITKVRMRRDVSPAFNTFATYETIKQEFGDEVADLVDGVTKISAFENSAGANSKVENFRKLILATSKDIRVLLVKIADRLHNMRTIKAITKEDKRKRIAQETMEIYAPLADRMGMHRIRDELEDLSFEILNNDARKLIKKRLDEIKLDRKDLFEEQSFELSEILNDNEINAEIHGREKNSFFNLEKSPKKKSFS